MYERLQINGYPEQVNTFANRTVEEFYPHIGIQDPVKIAYVLRNLWDEPYFLDKRDAILCDPQVANLEALVIGFGGFGIDDLVKVKKQLKNLEALFIGDLTSDKHQISWIYYKDLSPILKAYAALKFLQVRGNPQFSPLRHSNLETLIVEAGVLSRHAVTQICSLELPALEHLELWLGTNQYGKTSSIDDLTPILFGDQYLNLIYLGLRNSEYSDDIASALIEASVMKVIKVLDLSMGTLTDKGAEALLKCPTIEQLDLLKVSHNYLSNHAIVKLKQINIRVIANLQKIQIANIAIVVLPTKF
ncbi:MAG: HEAT repeat domain-containing protein [Hydrococcus sp. RM1_1_31]|nr:HEAT repeat domain-containing protein [Hydrococcus sp. RM1_1_31]